MTSCIPEIKLPPRNMRNHNDDLYLKSAIDNIETLDKLIGITPTDHIIDIGCAAGRLSLPLINRLDPERGGSYRGVDIKSHCINWAKEHIQEQWPHMVFEQIDVKSEYMNPAGKIDPGAQKFTIGNDWANLIILHSVFTHMREPGIRAYMAEAFRMLQSGGHLFFSLFEWNKAAAEAVKSGTASWCFPHREGRVRLEKLEKPELAVAITEELLRDLIREYDFISIHSHRGRWREGIPGGQDFAIFSKP